ncbi:hypothetical protein KP509_01G000200 [Ceratopteris richardii]|uniref:Glutamine amidotransferase type-2 domain-containing protein n=1 Tax=Ceratopteris richardii TaxID=49495 RepID=A0A8T2V9Z2_CERRI|nr:hypothetical protein KP509_01G000200 [Ceratopteris richardii]
MWDVKDSWVKKVASLSEPVTTSIMCGIGLIVSADERHEKLIDHRIFSCKELLEALRKRGPDSMGRLTLHHPLNAHANGLDDESSLVLEFMATTLQLRGREQICQPLKDQNGNVLIYNGEIFDGPAIKSDENDARVLLSLLGKCCSCLCHTESVKKDCICSTSEKGNNTHTCISEVLSSIRGPWTLVFWQAESEVLWFGRDILGRRSLLVHWPSSMDERLIFSSVSPPSNNKELPCDMFDYWEELPCAIYSINLKIHTVEKSIEGAVKHTWTDMGLVELMNWKRTHTEPTFEDLEVNLHSKGDNFQNFKADNSIGLQPVIEASQHQKVLEALRESVRRRTLNICKHDKDIMGHLEFPGAAQMDLEAPFAILFSGGLDSMILAAIADQCVPSEWTIDLLNVSFEGQAAPDRISAIAGVKELSAISSSRRWRLVEIDGDPASLSEMRGHLLSLICPSKTHMDLNIGLALWLASRGDGWITENSVRKEYKCNARVVLIGSGADEQCAGYGRHRTKFREGGWSSLEREMQLDMQRLWKRNLGRDDRCIADHGKEARFPYLDEDVMHSLLKMPLWDIADLRQPLGKGDKKILREVALMLGLKSAATLPKRAIQFGSRIAQESNRRSFGSNRAANLASAGSAVLPDI